mgnify:FL=1
MPFSSTSGKKYIKQVVEQLNPKRILDIGAGCGTYSKLFRKPEQHWTAIEIWRPYIDKYKLWNFYDKIIETDIRKWVTHERWDVAFAGDILEHMSVDEAQMVLAKLMHIADVVIVSIPLGYYPQDEYDGNPYEKHVVDHWTDELVRSQLGLPVCSHIDNEIGVYVYAHRFKVPKQLQARSNSMSLKIAVYAISKNEAQFVNRFLNSAKDADYIVIGDTGSTDSTVENIRSYPSTKVFVHDIYISPWRFDLARNAVLALIPADADICISLDMDEVLTPGWRAEIEKVWKKGETTRLRYGFDWGHNIIFQYEKIHARRGYRWHHPCHEYPVPDARITEVYAHTPMILVKHMPDPTKSRGQYLGLLELSVKEDPSCPRNAFYYARELTFHKRWADAAIALEKYLSMPNTWINERCYAMRLLGQCYENLNNSHTALMWYRRACAEAPGTREPWVDLAMFCYQKQMWAECYAAATNALRITKREFVYTCDPTVWGAKPYDLAAISAYHLGLYEAALSYGTEAAQLDPTDQRLANNVKFYSEKVTKVKGSAYASVPSSLAEVAGSTQKAATAEKEGKTADSGNGTNNTNVPAKSEGA